MSVVTATIEIAATPEQVWAVIMDPARLADWVTIHRSLGRHDEPLKHGSEIDQTLTLRGVPFQVKWKVEQFDPPRKAVWKGRGPARSIASTIYELEPSGDGTLFSYQNEFKAPMGPLGAVAQRALVGDAARREANGSLDRLKRLIES